MRLFIPLILTFYANVSFALSFGDATLKSYLGEPLIVKLNVTDVEKSPDTNCFTITDTNETPAFRKAFSTLTPYKDGYQLTVTTQSVITEPILGLRVSYHCEPQLDREYVLLLDPAPYHGEMPSNLSNTTQASDFSKQPMVSTDKANSANQSNNTTATDPVNSASSKTLSKAKRKSKKRLPNLSSSVNSVDEKIMDAYVGKQLSAVKQTPTTPAANNSTAVTPIKPSTSSKPYLSISGGSSTSDALNGQANLGLKFETQIDLNRAPPIAPIDSTEMMDEVTVLSNRLTHLEKQIISLQAQNNQLRNEATLAKNELENQKSSWLDYLLFGTASALLIAALEWLRRIWVTRRAIKQELSWLDAGDTEASDDEPSFSATITPQTNDSKQAKNSSFSASFLDDQSFDNEKIEPSSPTTLSIAEHVNDEHDSIIDNADVFIEHERPLLAIQLLQNHLNDFPMESPKIWLKLLSLIATEGSEAEYEAAAIEAKKYFNIRAPNYSDAKNEDPSSIEDFSNIVARLEGVWGSPFAVKFLNDLIYDHHAQPAEGFSPNNFEELFFLKKIAELLNTGVSTSQRTLYRTVATKPDSDSISANPAHTNLDNLAFNEAAFGNDMPFDQAPSAEPIEKASNSVITDEDFTVASFLDTPEQTKSNKLTKEEAHSQFENSPFQKVPSYDVDMLTDFDDHIDTAMPTVETPMLNDEANNPPITQDIKQPVLEKDNDAQEMAEEFHFPLDVYPEETMPEETTPEDSASTDSDNKPTPKKSKDSNIIEWDLPKLDS